MGLDGRVAMVRTRGSTNNMAKAALEALALTLYKEERRHNIHVNIVAPGLVETEMGQRLQVDSGGGMAGPARQQQ
jgi:NAD(P)-dependent dehydrogenase (short-subunit alcohol dehydrogenase family)